MSTFQFSNGLTGLMDLMQYRRAPQSTDSLPQPPQNQHQQSQHQKNKADFATLVAQQHQPQPPSVQNQQSPPSVQNQQSPPPQPQAPQQPTTWSTWQQPQPPNRPPLTPNANYYHVLTTAAQPQPFTVRTIDQVDQLANTAVDQARLRAVTPPSPQPQQQFHRQNVEDKNGGKPTAGQPSAQTPLEQMCAGASSKDCNLKLKKFETSIPIFQYAYSYSSALDEPMASVYEVNRAI